MGLIGVLALILITLLGYSSGAVIAGRGRKEPLSLLDFGIALVFLVLAFGTQSFLGKWLAIPIWFALACLSSALLTKARHKGQETKEVAHPKTPGTGLPRQIWEKWKAFAAEMGNYQGRLLFAFFYFIIVTPFGIGARLFSDPLRVKRVRKKTSWSERNSVTDKLDAARNQF